MTRTLLDEILDCASIGFFLLVCLAWMAVDFEPVTEAEADAAFAAMREGR